VARELVSITHSSVKLFHFVTLIVFVLRDSSVQALFCIIIIIIIIIIDFHASYTF
jgi:hypothetical protein